MADVLVITDRERIRAIFRSGKEASGYRLRTVPTLAQGEEEIADSPPTHVFAQSGISGVGGAEVMQHLKRLLPSATGAILLAEDQETLKRFGRHTLDLALPDSALAAAIANRVAVAGAGDPQGEPEESPAPDAPAATAKDLLFAARHDPAEAGPGKTRAAARAVALLAVGIALGGAAYRLTSGSSPSPGEGTATPQASLSAATPTGAPAHSAPPAAARSAGMASSGEAPVEYLVRPGDNIMKILTLRFGISEGKGASLMSEIKRLNNMQELRLLQPGQRLLLPAAVKEQKG